MSGVPQAGGGGDAGGDTGGDIGGGDAGGGGKGGGGGGNDNLDYSSPNSGTDFSAPADTSSSYAPTTTTPTDLNSWLGNPTDSAGGSTGSDFSGSDLTGTDSGGGTNLSGSGPVGGVNGTPGAGGGTNTPLAVGGVESFGATPSTGSAIDDFFSANQTVNNADFGQGASAPAGATAASVAAPAGVSGISDLTAPSVESGGGDKTGASGKTGTGGGNGASDSGNLMKSLGVNSPLQGLGIAAAAGGLLNSLINGNKSSPALQALQGQAATNNARAGQIIDQGQAQNNAGQADVATGRGIISTGQGQLDKGTALQQYIATGTLPQGYEDQVQQAARDAKTAVVSRYAAMGQNTDPLHNSQLQAELQQIDAKLPSMRETLASQLATSGNAIVGAGNQTIGAGNTTMNTGGGEGTNLINSGLQAAGISSGIYQSLANLDSATQQRQGQAIANFAAALNNTPRSVTLKTA